MRAFRSGKIVVFGSAAFHRSASRAAEVRALILGLSAAAWALAALPAASAASPAAPSASPAAPSASPAAPSASPAVPAASPAAPSGLPAALVAPGTSARAARALPPAALVHTENPSRAAIVNHRISVSLDPSASGLSAVDSLVVVHAPGIPATEAFPFLLWKTLEIRSVAIDPRLGVIHSEPAAHFNPRAFWEHPPYDQLGDYENAREIDLSLDPARGGSWPETLTVAVSYAGTVMDSLRPPQAAYARSFDTTAGLITQQGAFLAGSSFWVPARPDEVFTFRCEASVPVGWRAVSQGGLTSARSEEGERRQDGAGPQHDRAGSRQIDTWDCPHPMDELYLVAGPYALHQKDHNGVAVQTFTYANTDSALYTRYLDGTARYLDLYGGLIGPYPFEKFALVENFWQTGFGMPSFTLLGDRVIRLPFILDTSYGHEILHNWWGNSVFVDAEQGNWCEGLTTYGADYAYKEHAGADAAREYRLGALTAYLDYVSKGEDIPLSAFRERHDFATQAIGYSKSMMVIHQLRRRVGEDLFWKALRAFYGQNLWRRASWTDLLEGFRQVAGVDPGPFLHQWITRTGAPQIGVSDISCERRGKRWEVHATLTQALADGSRSGEPFAVTVPVRLHSADRDSTWQVPLDGWSQPWSATVEWRPEQLLVDPDFEVMRRIQRAEIPPTLSETLGADTVTVVIGSGLTAEKEKGYRDLAAEWAKGEAVKLVAESDQPNGWTPATSAWYLGLGPGARRLIGGLGEVQSVPAGGGGPKPGQPGAPPGRLGSEGELRTWRIAGKDFPDTCSVVLTGAFPGHPDRSWTVLDAPDAAQIAVVGDKVPHYGKYSFLVFAGGRNTGQGVWRQTASPLRIDLSSKSKIAGQSGPKR